MADITFGGTNLLNFDAVGASGPVRLGASVDSSINASAAIVPDSASRTLHFGAGDATLTLNNTLSDHFAGSTHVNFSGNGTTVLNAENTYTGKTTISGGIVETYSTTPFGTVASPTTITGGEVQVYTHTSEPFEVRGGLLNIHNGASSSFDISGGEVILYDPTDAPVFDNPVTMSGGSLTYNVSPNNTGTVTAAIDLVGGKESTIKGYIANNKIFLDGPIRGDGTLILETVYSQVIVQTAMTHTGDTVIYSDMWLNTSFGRGIYFESTQAFGGNLVMDGGILFNNAPNTVPQSGYEGWARRGFCAADRAEPGPGTARRRDQHPGRSGRYHAHP